jgi:uncharacterized phage protein gp47/JayE
MTTYGLTPTGFVRKTLAVIKSEIEADCKSTFGAGFSLASESPEGQFIGIFTEREAKVWEYMESVYNAGKADTAEGVQLDDIGALSGVKRKGKTFSKATGVILGGTAGTVIPAGKIVSVNGNPSARFKIDEDATIAAAVIEVQKVAFDHVPTAGNWTLKFGTVSTTSLAFNANAAAVQVALRLLSGLASLTVSGDYTAGFTITFTGTVGDQTALQVTPHTLTYASGAVTPTVTTLMPGVPPQVAANFTAESAGAVVALAASLTVIETPVSGWASATNPTDAAVGNEIESDPNYKVRRSTSVQKSANSTVPAIRAKILEIADVDDCFVFENYTSGTVSGRPPKSVEAIVLGGTDLEIGNAIWASKAGGIEPYGTSSVVITDSQGQPHTIGFSRPTVINIYLELDITVDGTFPLTGDDLVKAAILAYGDGLSMGDDVIVFPKLIAALSSITGINDVAIRIGTAPSPTLDNNIAIATTERAAFDTSRILVTHV